MNLIIGGVVAVLLGVWALVSWWWFLVEVIKGLITLLLIVGGVMTVAAGARKLRNEGVSEDDED